MSLAIFHKYQSKATLSTIQSSSEQFVELKSGYTFVKRCPSNGAYEYFIACRKSGVVLMTGTATSIAQLKDAIRTNDYKKVFIKAEPVVEVVETVEEIKPTVDVRYSFKSLVADLNSLNRAVAKSGKDFWYNAKRCNGYSVVDLMEGPIGDLFNSTFLKNLYCYEPPLTMFYKAMDDAKARTL